MGHMLGGQKEGKKASCIFCYKRDVHIQMWLEKAQMEGAQKI
jgi:hypothetical protein